MDRDMLSAELSIENSELSSIQAADLLGKSSWERLNARIDLFFKSLTLGRVRGIVSLVDFPLESESGNDRLSAYLQLIQDLNNRDILVMLPSCMSRDIPETGMLGADFFKGTGDGLAEFCDFIGIKPVLYIDSGVVQESDILDFYGELAQRASATMQDLPLAAIASGPDSEQSAALGRVFSLEDDPAGTVDLVDLYIHNKRLAMQWCDRCGGHFSPFS